MPFWRNYYHLVWATKERAPLIRPELEPHLYSYLQSKAREMGVHIYALNGWTDHLHVIASIPPRLAVADVVKRLKGASSHHLNHREGAGEPFRWQRGYGALTLGHRQLPRARAYVERQKEHHREQTTNAWLERTDAFEDGPPEIEARPAEAPAVRESDPVYDTTALPDIPF